MCYLFSDMRLLGIGKCLTAKDEVVFSLCNLKIILSCSMDLFLVYDKRYINKACVHVSWLEPLNRV